jgi:hypothetical protein
MARAAPATKFLSPSWSTTAATQRRHRGTAAIWGIPYANSNKTNPTFLLMLRCGFMSHVYLMHSDVVLQQGVKKDSPVLPCHTCFPAFSLSNRSPPRLGRRSSSGRAVPSLYAVRTLCGQFSRVGKKWPSQMIRHVSMDHRWPINGTFEAWPLL